MARKMTTESKKPVTVKGKKKPSISGDAQKNRVHTPRPQSRFSTPIEPEQRKSSPSGVDCIEGKHAVLEALEASVPISCILMQDTIQKTDAVLRIEALASDAGIEVKSASKARMESLSAYGQHQGVLAKTAPFHYLSVEELIERTENEESALIILLDHITDTGNFGAIVRTAEVVGATGIIIPNRRSVSVNSSVYKASAGAVTRLPVAQVANLIQAVSLLKAAGFWIVGASEKASEICWDTAFSGRIGLIMGSEETGLSRLVQETCDITVALPQRGTIGSLNVAQATSVLSYEWLRQSFYMEPEI